MLSLSNSRFLQVYLHDSTTNLLENDMKVATAQYQSYHGTSEQNQTRRVVSHRMFRHQNQPHEEGWSWKAAVQDLRAGAAQARVALSASNNLTLGDGRLGRRSTKQAR